MKKSQNNSARASALQITLSIAMLSISAILFASSFRAAPPAAQLNVVASQNASQAELGNVPGTLRQDGFFPSLPVHPTSDHRGFSPPLPAPPEGALITVLLPIA